MKSTWTLFLAALLALGLVIIGCGPSEVDPPNTIDDPDFVLNGGKYQFNFDEPRVVHGQRYEVTFTITECDEDFYGSRMGGKICYKMDLGSNDEKVLSGWLNAVPVEMTEGITEYKWTFIAGAANQDNVPIENPATTPEGGNQYFSFTAQTADYKDYSSNAKFGVKGGVTVTWKETVAGYESAGIIELGKGGDSAANPADGKGLLKEEDMVTIRALPPDSIIRFTVVVTPTAGTSEPGWGVGGIGGWNANNSVQINVPSDAVIGTEITFTQDIEISALLTYVGETTAIAVNPYNGAKVIKAELFKPE